MTEVVFYEKPGCVGNAKQKRLLAQKKHLLVVRNILSEPWSAERLRPFFGEKPVSAWFNPTAPRVKNGEVVPADLSEAEALRLMIAEPLLIRRPLIETPTGRCAGFEAGPVLDDLGIDLGPDEDLQSCARATGQPDCEPTSSAPAPKAGFGATPA